MSEIRMKHSVWRRSSYSGAGNDCVEIALVGGGAAVRDSKATSRGALLFHEKSWTAFLAMTRNSTDNH